MKFSLTPKVKTNGRYDHSFIVQPYIFKFERTTINGRALIVFSFIRVERWLNSSANKVHE